MSSPTHRCTWCTSGRVRAGLITALRDSPRTSPEVIALRFGTTAAFVYKVRSNATRRGCLQARPCEGCGKKVRPNGGRCRPCLRRWKTELDARYYAQRHFWWAFIVKRCARCGERISPKAKLYSKRSLCEGCPRERTQGVAATKGPPFVYIIPGPLSVALGSVDTKAERPVAFAQVLNRVGRARDSRSACTPS